MALRVANSSSVPMRETWSTWALAGGQRSARVPSARARASQGAGEPVLGAAPDVAPADRPRLVRLLRRPAGLDRPGTDSAATPARAGAPRAWPAAVRAPPRDRSAGSPSAPGRARVPPAGRRCMPPPTIPSTSIATLSRDERCASSGRGEAAMDVFFPGGSVRSVSRAKKRFFTYLDVDFRHDASSGPGRM